MIRYRRKICGYTDMGRPRVPPLPSRLILHDRADDTRWLISHSFAVPYEDGLGLISITDSIPANATDLREYEAFEEPVFATEPTIRLIVRGGYLGYSFEGLDHPVTDRDNAPHMTRRGNHKETREIIIPTGWEGYPETLGWQPVEI